MNADPELPVRLPEQLSDETIASLVDARYAFAEALENRYYAELQRHYRNKRRDPGSNEPGSPDPFPPF
jgi:hypothetical protein